MPIMEEFLKVRTNLNKICRGDLFAGHGEVTVILDPKAYDQALKTGEERARTLGLTIDPKVYERGWFTVFGVIYKRRKIRKKKN